MKLIDLKLTELYQRCEEIIAAESPIAPIYSDKIHSEIGNCPKCGERFWLNDVPLRGFCWGTADKPHSELVKKIPNSVQPYK